MGLGRGLDVDIGGGGRRALAPLGQGGEDSRRLSPLSSAAPLRAAEMARHTRSGVHGISMWRTPRWLTASITAFCTAGIEPIVPDSPIPLAPTG